MKRRYYDKQSMFFHLPKPGQSTAEHILSTYRPDQKFTHEEAKLLDMCLLVHADHGGGNCSTFTARVLSSSGTDTYSAIAAAIGALKGPKHGGANLMVNRQLKDILKHVENPEDDDEVREYLRRILRKQAGDGSGLIYGMGHAVYTISDPREVILKQRARHLAYEKGFEEEYNMPVSYTHLPACCRRCYWYVSSDHNGAALQADDLRLEGMRYPVNVRTCLLYTSGWAKLLTCLRTSK